MIEWHEALEIIQSKELGKLVRSEQQTQLYLKAKAVYKEQFGGTAQFVIHERLKWYGDALKASGDPFLENWDDIQILTNDFRYDFADGIEHFVVWLKTPIPCNSDELPTAEASRKIDEFLDKYIVQRCGVARENIAWFKNTTALQSIPTVSHFHVLIRDCTPEIREMVLRRPSDIAS